MKIVITGTGIVSPAGIGVPKYVQSLRTGDVCIRPLSQPSLSLSEAQIAGEVQLITPEGQVRFQQFARIALQEALNEAQLSQKPARFGLVVATAIGATREMDNNFSQELPIPADLIQFGSFADKLIDELDIQGPCFTITTGCAASLDAVGCAIDEIRSGAADVMMVVSADATISPITFAAFDQIGALSKRNLAQGASQPFGVSRDGFVLAEAGAAILLESFEHAKFRRANALVEVVDCASVNNAFHMTSMRTDGSDLIRLINLLLSRAGVLPNEIDLVDMHGTSTVINDQAEANAIRAIFGGQHPLITAQKAHTGHALGASNLVELIGLSRMMLERFVPMAPMCSAIDESLGIKMPHKTIDNFAAMLGLKISSSFSGIHSAALLRQI